MDTDRMVSLREDRGRRRRSRAVAHASSSTLLFLLAAAQLLQSSPVPCCNATTTTLADAAPTPIMERRNNDYLRRRRRHDDGDRRRRIQQTYTNSCKDTPTLHPGESLLRGEFLCHGNLRFGIDADLGQFIVGFANSTSNSTGTNNGTVDSANGANNDPNGINNAASANTATPTSQAWRAIPTTLFISPTQPFSYLTLTDDGNILGYDSFGIEIYDSNYDYINRMRGKEDNSVLGFSDDCLTVHGIGDGVTMGGGGEQCVTLTSPAAPGMPYGMVTWGVRVEVADIVEIEPTPTPSPNFIVASPTPPTTASASSVSNNVNQPTLRPTRRTKRPTVTSNPPSRTPTQGLFSDKASSDDVDTESLPPPDDTQYFESPDDTTQYFESTSVIWGTVWLDSNKNGAMDLGEQTIEDFEVRLLECSDARSNNGVDNDGQGWSGQVIGSNNNNGQGDNNYDGQGNNNGEKVVKTDPDGMYFFRVPSDRTYRVKFDIQTQNEYGYSHSNNYGYSQGKDTSTNMMGWTDCERSESDKSPIQWNAGLYNVPPMSSIGGFIYLDVDENGKMDSNERTAAVGRYPVNDAMIVVSLTDCKTDLKLESLDVPFPGTYSFGNLTEGLYKLGYEMQIIARNSANLNNAPVPLYSFVDGTTAQNNPTVYETACGKLGKSEIIDSGNVGLRSPLFIMPLSAGGPVGPTNLLEDLEAMANNTERDTIRTAAAEGGEDDVPADGKGSFVPALVGVLVTLSVVAAASVLFVKRRNGGLGSTFPFLASGKTNGEHVRSVGSSIDGDNASMVSATPSSAQHTAIGSLIVETGKSVANMTAVGDDDDSGSGSSSSSDEDSEDDSYTGMEFALKQQQQQEGANSDDVDNIIGGGSPYQSQFSSPSSDKSNNVQEVEEGGSDGYEVYDDDEEQGDADYGHVISDMIAKYSQKQGQSGDELPAVQDQGEPRDAAMAYNQVQDQGHPQENYSQHQVEHEKQGWAAYQQDQSQKSYSQHQNQQQEQRGDYPHQDQSQNWKQYQVQDHSSNTDELAIVSSNQENAQQYQQETDYQGHYSNSNINAYDTAPPQHPHQYNANNYGDQYDETTSISESSRSSDPPAASYRDIPAANVGWDRGGVPQQQTEDHHQYVVGDGAYPGNHESNQYAAGDGAPHAGHYESSQYAVGDGTQAGKYESNQYNMANDESAAYDANYDNYDEQHPPIDSNSSSSSESSKEEASNSGWSSSSSATHASAVSGGSSNWSRASDSASAKSRARRAQSNPRDDRRGSWSHQAAIPENSTLEYNAYTKSNQSNNDHGHNTSINSGFAPTTQADDNKSVVSSDSDKSADPPGASYKNLHQFPPPPPPRRTTPPRRTSPNIRRAASNPRRGRSVPPPPPRSHPSPPPSPR